MLTPTRRPPTGCGGLEHPPASQKQFSSEVQSASTIKQNRAARLFSTWGTTLELPNSVAFLNLRWRILPQWRSHRSPSRHRRSPQGDVVETHLGRRCLLVSAAK
jgi:hypothetical protein